MYQDKIQRFSALFTWTLSSHFNRKKIVAFCSMSSQLTYKENDHKYVYGHVTFGEQRDSYF